MACKQGYEISVGNDAYEMSVLQNGDATEFSLHLDPRRISQRVVGSIRRECPDHIVIFYERHLARVLSSYIEYYHRSRTYLWLNKDCPYGRPIRPRPVWEYHRHPTGRRLAP